MTAWFIRLGRTDPPAEKVNWELYQDLADNHSLIIINYGIKVDLTQAPLGDIQQAGSIKHHLYTNGESGQSLASRAGIINNFINEVRKQNKDELVISPYKDHYGYFQIGLIKSDCKTVGSFFQNNKNVLTALAHKHRNVEPRQKPIAIKPARQVEWKYHDVPLNLIPPPLDVPMSKHKKKQRGVNDLKVSGTVNFSGLSRYAVNGGISGSFTI